MSFNKIKLALYAMWLTNLYGFKLKKVDSVLKKKRLREEYANKLFEKLNIQVTTINPEKVPIDAQFLLISNHRSIIDPLIIDIAFTKSRIFTLWIAKEALAKSPFYSTFVNHAGTILINRESKSMGNLFKKIKQHKENGNSISIFPEGTRNKSQESLTEFKKGTKIIALKNRLPILPVYIKTNAQTVLESALKDNSKPLEIVIEIGDMVESKTKKDIQEIYMDMFKIE